MTNLAKIHATHNTSAYHFMNTEELKSFYQIIERCHQAKSQREIDEIIKHKVRQLIPHTMTAYGFGEFPSRRILASVNLGFPEDYMAEVVNKNNLLDSPVAKQWAGNQDPIMVTDETIPKKFPLAWQQAFRNNEINNLIAHGLVDMTGKQTSYFTFGHFKSTPGERETHIISLIVPHLHVAITRILDNASQKLEKDILSKRESEIIKWVYEGKTNSEIGELLCISGFTVKNHIKNILEKLGAANRTHAVAKAVNLGIIEIN